METGDIVQYGGYALVAALFTWIGKFLNRKDLKDFLPKNAKDKMIEYLKEEIARRDIILEKRNEEINNLIRSLVKRKNPTVKNDSEGNS